MASIEITSDQSRASLIKGPQAFTPSRAAFTIARGPGAPEERLKPLETA